FQAEDGIRAFHVTGVQTCALPIFFRRTFDVLGAPAKAQLRITADTRYVLHVNGERVGQGPARGFPDHYFVDTWDVTPLILPGAKIGRASCRETGKDTEDGAAVEIL